MGTTALQGFWVVYFRDMEAFRLKALVLGAQVSETQVEASRVVLSVAVACLVMGVATAGVGLVFQRLQRASAPLWVRMAGLSLLAGTAMGTFFIGRYWGFLTGG